MNFETIEDITESIISRLNYCIFEVLLNMVSVQKEKEFISDLITKQKDCEFSLRFILQKEDDTWKNVFTMLKLVKKGTRNEVNYDYGEYVVGEKLLNIQEGLDMISNLYPKKDEKGKFVISEYDEFEIVSRHQLQLVPSKQRSGIIKSIWPMRFCGFKVQNEKVSRRSNRELLKEGFPYYPDVSEVVIKFFDLAVEHFSSYGEIYVVVVDYRAKIESLKLLFSKAELKLCSPEIDHKELIVKVFAKSGLEITTLPDIYPKSESVRFELDFQPDNLSVALLSRKDNIKIDGKELAKWRREEEEGIFIERPEEAILSLARAGESQTLEYKYDITNDDKSKNDFIESVVAFLNRNRGTILIGVSDHGDIVGTQKNKEDIQKLIHDSCDPPPEDIKIEEKPIAEKKVIIVEVPEGQGKPYQSKRDKNFYVRHNGSDMRMERSEMLFILLNRQQVRTGYE